MTFKSIRVVAAVVQSDDKYLITRRREEAALGPLMWEFPGGRVEPGETDAQALRREIRERLGVEIEPGKPVAFRRHDYDGYSIELVLYEAMLVSGDLESKRVKEYRWVPAAEFAQYAFPPADQNTLDDFQVFVTGARKRKPPTA